MFVRLWMTTAVETACPTDSVGDCRQRMVEGHFRRLPVVEDEELVGLVTVRDLEMLGDEAVDEEIGGRMATEVVTVDPYAPLEDAVALMRKHKIGGLPVVSKGKLVGVISESDVFDALCKFMAAGSDAARITFDIVDSRDALAKVLALCERYGLEVLSFVAHQRHADPGRRIVAIRAKSKRIGDFVDALWKAKHRVLQVLIPGRENETLAPAP